MNDKKYAAACGIYCGNCDFSGEQCKGCGHSDGRPFWTAQVPSGVCPIHDCCSNQKKIEHCGLCEELPCRTFLELRDPDMSDEEFEKSLKARQESLKRRKDIGTGEWLREMSR
jgi:hypothetical protein